MPGIRFILYITSKQIVKIDSELSGSRRVLRAIERIRPTRWAEKAEFKFMSHPTIQGFPIFLVYIVIQFFPLARIK